MIKENVDLQQYNTFKVKANAKYFATVSHESDLVDVLAFAQREKLQILVLGGGSNVLLINDFQGIVIYINSKGITSRPIDERQVLVSAKAGENWADFVAFCVNNGWGGVENLSLIPGTVGAAPVQNIGAYGVEMKDCFHSCKVWDTHSAGWVELGREACDFSYRDSIFKSTERGRYIITEVSFILKKEKYYHPCVSYGHIIDELKKSG